MVIPLPSVLGHILIWQNFQLSKIVEQPSLRPNRVHLTHKCRKLFSSTVVAFRLRPSTATYYNVNQKYSDWQIGWSENGFGIVSPYLLRQAFDKDGNIYLFHFRASQQYYIRPPLSAVLQSSNDSSLGRDFARHSLPVCATMRAILLLAWLTGSKSKYCKYSNYEYCMQG